MLEPSCLLTGTHSQLRYSHAISIWIQGSFHQSCLVSEHHRTYPDAITAQLVHDTLLEHGAHPTLHCLVLVVALLRAGRWKLTWKLLCAAAGQSQLLGGLLTEAAAEALAQIRCSRCMCQHAQHTHLCFPCFCLHYKAAGSSAYTL